ncbi:MAG: aldo/keto reductase [Nitrospirota bacterium]|nr:aldo/keto reductase [Nitrospirota bacterium]MDH5586708.1 aldo/keto reductase [Nitrospirota bacterium]
MIVKHLGDSGIQVSAIGQGTCIHDSLTDQEKYRHLERTILTGIDWGLNFIDTAPVYGSGESEAVIGRAVKGIRKQVVLATKVSPECLGRNQLVASVTASLKRLQTDWIDLLQIHWPNPNIAISETLAAMERLVKDGVVRYLGICNFSLKETKEIQRQLSPNLLVSLQVEYNLFDRSNEKELLSYGQQKGLSIVAYSPLHRGRVVANAKQWSVLQELARKYQKTPAQIVLRWLIGQQSVIAIPNTTNPGRMVENAQSMGFDLEDEDVRHLGEKCTGHFKNVPPRSIQVADDSGRSVYRTLEEAMANALNFVPSPQDLAMQIEEGDFVKPVRLRPAKSSGERFELLEGRIRYWAWVIAHGFEKPMPALIEDFS